MLDGRSEHRRRAELHPLFRVACVRSEIVDPHRLPGADVDLLLRLDVDFEAELCVRRNLREVLRELERRRDEHFASDGHVHELLFAVERKRGLGGLAEERIPILRNEIALLVLAPGDGRHGDEIQEVSDERFRAPLVRVVHEPIGFDFAKAIFDRRCGRRRGLRGRVGSVDGLACFGLRCAHDLKTPL